jgi:hypothetical protein
MNEQYLYMLRVYFECGDNSYQASQRYQQLYPNRDHPNRCKFQRLANNLRNRKIHALEAGDPDHRSTFCRFYLHKV